MLTFRTFEAGAPSGAARMAAHLLTQTLPPEEVACRGRLSIGREGLYLDLSRAIATVRHDLHPGFNPLLGVRAGSPVGITELAALLAGLRADGTRIVGRQYQSKTMSLADELGLDPERLASIEEARAVMAGVRADDGHAFAEGRAPILQKRFCALYGITGEDSAARLDDLVRWSRNGKGGSLNPHAYSRQLALCRRPLGHLHLCLSADKDIGIAWAFARTDAERALIEACHVTACLATMSYLDGILGHARRGKGGSGGSAGYIAFISVEHYTGRPTLEATRGIRISGDPLPHSHIIVPNVVLTDGGHVAALNLNVLEGRVLQVGAFYSAVVADELRGLGMELAFDRDVNRARVVGIPARVRDAFSKRTIAGTQAARNFAGLTGDEWAALWAPERSARTKAGVQGDPRSSKTDDVAHFAAWRAEAAQIGWEPNLGVDLDRPTRIEDRDLRIAKAVDEGARQVEAACGAGTKIDAAFMRLAATRGLIASGIDGAADIGTVAAKLEQRFANRDDIGSSLTIEKGKQRAKTEERASGDLERATATIDAMRANGTASLVEGGEAAVLEKIADLWISCAVKAETANLPTIGLGTNRSAVLVTSMIRSRRREAGALGEDKIEFESIDDAGQPASIRIAIHDPVRLTARSRSDLLDRRRGVASVKANLQTVVAMEKRWLVLETPGGRRGRVLWHDLQSTGGAPHYRLTHGYVVPTAALGSHKGERIEGFPGGMAAEGPYPRDVLKGGPERRHVIIDADAERRAIARSQMGTDPTSISDEDVWIHVARTLSARRSVAAAMALVRRACEMAAAAGQTMRIAVARIETRIAAGLSPTTMTAKTWLSDRTPELTRSKELFDGAKMTVNTTSDSKLRPSLSPSASETATPLVDASTASAPSRLSRQRRRSGKRIKRRAERER